MPWRPIAALLVVLGCVGSAAAEPVGQEGAPGCPTSRTGDAYRQAVLHAVAGRRDVWGERLLASPSGPTYAGARRYLAPLFLARADRGSPLTDSGVHYLPFGRPTGPGGSGSVPLHVADGSQIVSQRRLGATLTVLVGPDGHERFGSCLSRLGRPSLAGGWLPVLRTAYADAGGATYRQESFAAPLPGGGLASFVRVAADTHGSRAGATVRLVSSGDRTLSFRVPPGATRTVYLAWPNRAVPDRLREVDPETYDAARRSVRSYWFGQLSTGAQIEVPERVVRDATRALLWQNLVLGWRYSVGNHYQQLATADGLAAADVMGRYGFGAVDREALRVALSPQRPQTPYRNWKLGAKLGGVGQYDRLYHDTAFVEEATPALRGYVAELGEQIDADPRGLLRRERYSSDVPDAVLGLHAQAVVWSGLRLMGRAWARTGHDALARRCAVLAERLGAGLRAAVRRSATRLPDGSLFVPMRLYDDERPYDALSASRNGSYWNLVAPYAFATRILPPGGDAADGVLAYLERHGARLLGLVRTGAYALYGRDAVGVSGTDQVYGLSLARFLADNDRPDQLVLSLYGQIAAGMTQGTFVSGEAASVTPLPGTTLRAMYLPPNGTSNAAFLETLRLMLVHEAAEGALELAHATPRAWLRPGGVVGVRRMPTSFGPVTFAIRATRGGAHISLELPAARRPRLVRIRVRLPHGRRIVRVEGGGATLPLARDAQTIVLRTPPRRLALVVTAGS